MSNKTPYEIRLELLKLANEVLVAPVFNARDAIMQEYHSKLTDDNRELLSFPLLPAFPTTVDIIAEAEKMNEFISRQS
jgi:hypothetical protein